MPQVRRDCRVPGHEPLRAQVVGDGIAGLAEAVRVAASSARAGQSVVLAPGCASFDEFRDYTERGRTFRALVEAL